MSDSSNKPLPTDDDPNTKPIEQLGQPELVDMGKQSRAEETTLSQGAEERVDAPAEIAHSRPAAVKARRRGGIQHRPVVTVVMTGPNAVPSLDAANQPPPKPITTPGIGPTVPSAPIDPRPTVRSAPTPLHAETVETPPVEKLQRAGRNAALMGFSAAQAELEAQLDGRVRRQLFVDRETVEREKLDPSSEAYLQIAERCLEAGCDLSKDEGQAERDREAVNARRATRDVPISDVPVATPRKNRTPLIIGVLFALGLFIAGGFYHHNLGDRVATPGATAALTSALPAPTVSVLRTSTTANDTATLTSTIPAPTQTAIATHLVPTVTSEVVPVPPPTMSAIPTAPPVVHSASAKPPATATPAPTATTSFTAKWITP